MDKQTFILKYLHEELSDSEYNEFVSLTESDPQFAEDVEIESILYAQHKQNLKQEILSISNVKILDTPEPKAQVENAKTGKLRNLFPFIRNIAAVFLLAFLSYYLFVNKPLESKDPQVLVSSYLKNVHSPPSSLRGEDTLQDDPWTIGIESYKLNGFDVAIDQFEMIQNRTNEQNLYLGLSRLYSPDREMNLDKAISDFESVISTNKMPRTDEAQWFLSIAYILNGDLAQAKENLSEIISNNSWNATKAAELLKRIKE